MFYRIVQRFSFQSCFRIFETVRRAKCCITKKNKQILYWLPALLTQNSVRFASILNVEQSNQMPHEQCDSDEYDYLKGKQQEVIQLMFLLVEKVAKASEQYQECVLEEMKEFQKTVTECNLSEISSQSKERRLKMRSIQLELKQHQHTLVRIKRLALDVAGACYKAGDLVTKSQMIRNFCHMEVLILRHLEQNNFFEMQLRIFLIDFLPKILAVFANY